MQSPVVPGYTERSRYIVHDLREPVAENRFAWPAINYVALTSKPSYVDDGITRKHWCPTGYLWNVVFNFEDFF